MLGIGKGGWTVVLLILNVVVLSILALWCFLNPVYETTGTVRVPLVLPRPDPNDIEKHHLMLTHEEFKEAVVHELVSDRVMKRWAEKLAGMKLELFRDTPNRLLALRWLFKKRGIVIDTYGRLDQITIRLTSRFPSDAETIINCHLDSYTEMKDPEDPTLTIMEETQRQLLTRMKQPDPEDFIQERYNAVTRQIEGFKAKTLPPKQVTIDGRAQSVPVMPHRKQLIVSLTVVEVLLVLALIRNLASQLRQSRPAVESDPDKS